MSVFRLGMTPGHGRHLIGGGPLVYYLGDVVLFAFYTSRGFAMCQYPFPYVTCAVADVYVTN